MRILWFNWRDIRNPAAGGAEVFTHEVIRRLAKKGYQITLFASQYPGCAKKETLEDVDIIRDGGRYGVYKKSIEYYRMHREDYDLIIDEINTRPFLTPKFVTRQRIIALIHQLAREFWFYETPFPLNYVSYYYLENKWLSYYRNTPIITVSASSKKDLEELGFKNIFIVPEGLNVVPLANVPEKELQPTIIFTGRLKRVKLPHHAIKAFSIIKNEIPDARMWVVGDGYMMDELKNMNVKDVIFYGHVNDELKYHLMSRAHVSIVQVVSER